MTIAFTVLFISILVGMIVCNACKWKKVLVGFVWALFLLILITMIIGAGGDIQAGVVVFCILAPSWYTWLFLRNGSKKTGAETQLDTKLNPEISDCATVIVAGERAYGTTEPKEKVKEVVIPEGTKIVHDAAFRGYVALEKVVFPSSLTHIGVNAFRDCMSLKSVIIPDGVVFVGSGAFMNCGSLQQAWLSIEMNRLNDDVFTGCTSMKTLTVPGQCTELCEEGLPHKKIIICTGRKSKAFEFAKKYKYRMMINSDF